MHRPSRRSRLGIVASLVALVAETVLTTAPAVVASGPKTGGAHPSAITRLPDIQAGSRGSINVKDLVGTARTAPARPKLPYLGLPSPASSGGAASGPSVVTPEIAATPPVPVTPTTEPPATGPSWPGFDFADALNEPPDPWVGVGPDHVVQTVNTVVQMFDRAGNVDRAASDIGAAAFFDLPPRFGNSDPRFIYDSLHGRWVGTEVSWVCDFNDDAVLDDNVGYIDFLVSRTADPTGTWDLWYFGFLNQLPDFPAPGTSTDKLAFTGNFFELTATPDCLSSNYLGTAVVVTDWTDVLARGGANGIIDAAAFVLGTDSTSGSFFTARAGVQVPATSSTLHVVAQHFVLPGPTIGSYYAKFTGTVADGTIAVAFGSDLTTDGIVAETIDPPDPLQPGGTPVLTSLDARPTDAIWQNGRFTWVSTNGCTPNGDTMERACVRVTQLNTGGAPASPPTRAKDFLIGEKGKDDYFAGVGQSGNGTLHVVWTQSFDGLLGQPSSWTSYQLPGDPANSLNAMNPTAPGTGGAFIGGRWGDYVGVAQDPQVPDAVWQANQVATGGLNWATTVSQLQTGGATYVPIDPVRVLDSRFNVGVTGAFNANTAKSFTVAGFVSTAGTIPEDAIAVTGNVTVTGQTAAGYVSVTTTPTSTPASSTLNFPNGDTRANNITTPVASNGELSAVYKASSGKKAHILFDVTGYFLPGTENAAYNTLSPVRFLDSRVGIGTGLTGRFKTGVPRRLTIAGVHGIPTNAVAITANLTVVGQTKAGYVSVTPTNTPSPATSNLNFPLGDVRANGLTATLGGDSIWLVYKGSAGSRTDLILDVTGYYLPVGDGLEFHALNPGRIMDTRTSVLSGLTGLFSHNVTRKLDTDGHWGVPPGAKAVTGNLTVTAQTNAGYVSVTPDPVLNPTTSTINFPLGDTRANGVTVPLNVAGNMSLIYKASAGKKTHLILDVTGYFE